jgi:ribosome assembly protein 1
MFSQESEYPKASYDLLKDISSGDASPDAEPTVAYLSKQFAVTTHKHITNSETGDELEDSREKLIGMARVFHGKLSVGQEIFVLRPKFNPAHPEDGHFVRVTVHELFLLMGRDLEPVETVYAGNVFGIGGLEEHVGKSATLSTSLNCLSFDCSSLQKVVKTYRLSRTDTF